MPSDVVGATMIAQGEDGDGGSLGLRFEPGPVFANLVLADKIKRLPEDPILRSCRPCRSGP